MMLGLFAALALGFAFGLGTAGGIAVVAYIEGWFHDRRQNHR
jgi:hypothetical protein